MENMKKKQKGFTLIEILIVIGLIAILATVVLVALNPARQFAQARNSQRTSNVNTILNAIGQSIADNKGVFNMTTCTSMTANMTASTTYDICAGSSASCTAATNKVNISCLVPTYIANGLPYDPNATGAHWTSSADYDTQYNVMVDYAGRYTISAPNATTTSELSQIISVTR